MDKSKSSRTLHFTAPGMKSQHIDIAPESDEPLSKRYDILTSGDDLLDANQHVLEDGTKARNRAFQDRLDEVWSSTAGYEVSFKRFAMFLYWHCLI
jgi:hypothetical protein